MLKFSTILVAPWVLIKRSHSKQDNYGLMIRLEYKIIRNQNLRANLLRASRRVSVSCTDGIIDSINDILICILW